MEDGTKKKIKPRKKLIILTVVVIILLIIAVSTYPVIKWNVEKVNKAATAYTGSVSINNNGSASTEVSSSELWKQMIDAGYDVNKYLKNPRELERLLNAELVTQLPDTRSDVTKEIDWDKIFKTKSSNSNATSELINVLFVGNSKTFHNELPTQFQALAESLGKQVYAVRTKNEWGARTLNSFLDEDGPAQDFKERVSERKWDYVVVQEQTDTSLDKEEYMRGARRVIEYVKENSNKDVTPIYDAWSVMSDFNETQYNIATSNCEAAKEELGGEVAYIANGLLECHSKYPEINLFSDSVHPTKAGTYLAACCTYAAIYEEKTEGATFKFDLPDEDATHIQQIADGVQGDLSGRKHIQGIIKFKRHDEDNNEYYLTYVTPTEFQNQVEIYNKSGSETAKEFVLKHYTLKENPVAKTLGTINGTGSFPQYNLSPDKLYTLACICTREQGDAKGAAAEASLMANLFELSGGSFGEGADGLYNYVMTSGWFGIPGNRSAPSSIPDENLQAVEAVLVKGYRTLPKYVNEHDCINPPDIINPPARREDFIPFQTVLHNIYGSTYTFYCFPTEISDPFGYTSEANRQKYGDFCYEYGTWQPINGTEDKNVKDVKATTTTDKDKKEEKKDDKKEDKKTNTTAQSGFNQEYSDISQYGYSHTYTTSTGITYKDFKQISPAPYASEPYRHDGSTISTYGCGTTAVATILSGLQPDLNYTPKETTREIIDKHSYIGSVAIIKEFFENHGIPADGVDGGVSAEEIANQLKNGKTIIAWYGSSVFYRSGIHFISIVDMNENGEFLVLNPGCTNDYANGKASGWFSANDIETNMQLMVAVDTSGAGVSVGNGATPTSSAPGYQAIVGAWHQVNKTTEIDGPNPEAAASAFGVEIENGPPSYSMSTAIINYEEMVQPYTLSFDLLWTLLVIGQTKGFVMSLADLAYNSEIEVSIYDTLRVKTDKDFWSYAEATSQKVGGTVSYSGNGASASRNNFAHEHLYENGNPAKKEDGGKVNKTVITYDDTIVSALTKAHTWIANRDLNYVYSKDDGAGTSGSISLENQKITGWHNVDISNDVCDKIKSAVKEVVSDVNSQLKSSSSQKSPDQVKNNSIDASSVDTSKAWVKEKVDRVEIVDNTFDNVEEKKYIADVPTLIIKDDKTTEPNFVTLFNNAKYRDNKNNILSAPELLFELLAENDKTKNGTIDIIKYLLYKVTDIDYGVTDVDEIRKLFAVNSLTPVGGNAYTNGYDVKIDSEQGKPLAPTKEQIKKALEYEAKKFHADKIKGDVDKYWERQVSTKVNAIFGIAVSAVETGCGTATVGQYSNGTNNMFSYGRIYNGKDRAGRDKDIELFTKGISGSTYFGSGHYTVNQIADVYAGEPEGANEWRTAVNAEMTKLFEVAGIEVPTMADSEILTVAQKCIEQLVGFTYTGGSQMPLTNGHTCDCSAYVSWVLYEWGYKDAFAGYQKGTDTIGDVMLSLGGQKIPATQVQPGDILVRNKKYHGNGHTEIYAGNGMSYNGGQVPSSWSGTAVVTPGPTPTCYFSDLNAYDYAVRMPKP